LLLAESKEQPAGTSTTNLQRWVRKTKKITVLSFIGRASQRLKISLKKKDSSTPSRPRHAATPTQAAYAAVTSSDVVEVAKRKVESKKKRHE
jgi:hypothetical protein